MNTRREFGALMGGAALAATTYSFAKAENGRRPRVAITAPSNLGLRPLRSVAHVIGRLLPIGLGILAACSPLDHQDSDALNAAAKLPQLWTPAAIATDRYESSPTFTPDGREMYFVSADRQFRNYRILRSRCGSGVWSAPEPVPFGLPLPIIEADPHVTQDGKRLYFISSRQAPDREDFDIWYVERTGAGAWGSPQRLPEPVNSPAAELLPRTSGDGTLYFGSDRSGGFGQSDIYAATQQPDGSWSVVNVGPPVSTAANDFEAEVSTDGRALVLVSDRGDKSHLYRFTRRDGKWVAAGQIPASDEVFQVGPILSPAGDRLLFAQTAGQRSGEIYMLDLEKRPDPSWPPCRTDATR